MTSYPASMTAMTFSRDALGRKRIVLTRKRAW